jgi:hypothetical protein
MAMINPADVLDLQAPQTLPVQTFPASVPAGVPPAMPGFVPQPSAATSSRIRPAYPQQISNPPVMGMDPTAPPSYDKPVAPPPMAGFYRK